MVVSDEAKSKGYNLSGENILDIDTISDECFINLVYQIILKRKPDPEGFNHCLREIKNGRVPRLGIVDEIIRSSEYFEKNIPPLVVSLHLSRCMWIKNLPRANLIVDLGGSSAGEKRGALVAMGYPYSFNEIFIVDLPIEKRHKIYAEGYEEIQSFQSDRGKITYIYKWMNDLRYFLDSTIDFINMGQSIEHITESEGDHVLRECFRILKPGGFLCIDTPNRSVTRLQSDSYIDPDHKIEYSHSDLLKKINLCGFTIIEQKGLNYMPFSIKNNSFNMIEACKNYGMYDDIEQCYLLAYRCQKPLKYWHQ